jgi:hypothetical protein
MLTVIIALLEIWSNRTGGLPPLSGRIAVDG